VNFRQEKLNRIEEERMKSREIKVQLNKATRSDAEPSPRKTEDKEPEWVSKRKSVTINAPVKIEKDIVFKEERDVTAPWAKDLKLKKSTTKEPAPLVQAPSTQQDQPKAQIIAKGVASGGENPWGVQLKKNRPGETEEPKPTKSEPVPEFVQKSLARKSVKLDKSAIENAQNGGTSSNPTSARSSEPTSARALSAVDEDAEIERMVREEMEREEAERQKKRDEEKRKNEEADRLIREELEREEAELKQKEEERKAREAEEKRKAEEEETKKRADEEAENKRKADEQAENERLAREAEEKRKADEAEAKRREEEEAENKRKAEEAQQLAREAEEAENKRKAEEVEQLAREAEEAENKRKADEQAENERLAREAEEKHKAEQESEAKVAPSATAGGIDSTTFAAALKRVQDLEAWVEKSQGSLSSLENDNKSLKESLNQVKENNEKLTKEVADLQKILDGLN
jgi:hypothetical protein